MNNCAYCGIECKGKCCSKKHASYLWRKNNPEKYKIQQKRADAKQKGVNRYNSEVKKKWLAKQDESYFENRRQQAVRRYRELQEFIRGYKIGAGCSYCGYNEHHSALHFHHIDKNKEINVCNAKSIGQAKKEIEKCIVLCANCHSIETYNAQRKVEKEN